MDDSKEIIAQLKKLSLTVTESTYDVEIQQGYKLLLSLHDLGLEKDKVYQILFQYHNSLEDSLSRDYVADILDYIVGWCSPQYYIWET